MVLIISLLKNKSFIKRFITILELPEDIKFRIQWKGVPGSISFTTAYIIAIDIPEEKQRVIEYLRTEEGKLISKNDLLKLVIDSRLS